MPPKKHAIWRTKFVRQNVIIFYDGHRPKQRIRSSQQHCSSYYRIALTKFISNFKCHVCIVLIVELGRCFSVFLQNTMTILQSGWKKINIVNYITMSKICKDQCMIFVSWQHLESTWIDVHVLSIAIVCSIFQKTSQHLTIKPGHPNDFLGWLLCLICFQYFICPFFADDGLKERHNDWTNVNGIQYQWKVHSLA